MLLSRNSNPGFCRDCMHVIMGYFFNKRNAYSNDLLECLYLLNYANIISAVMRGRRPSRLKGSCMDRGWGAGERIVFIRCVHTTGCGHHDIV